MQATINRMPRFCLCVFLATLLLLNNLPNPQASQGARKTPGADARPTGKVVNGVYRNPSFGFACKVPFGWVDRTADMREEGSAEGKEAAKSLVLLAVFERPPEATGNTINSAIVIAAEKTSEYSGLKTAADYFGPITELATAKGLKVINEPYDFPVDAKRLVRGDFSKPRGSLTMVQSSLVILEKGYAVSFTFIGGSEDEVNGLVGNLKLAGEKGASLSHK